MRTPFLFLLLTSVSTLNAEEGSLENQTASPTVQNEALRQELLAMGKAEQQARTDSIRIYAEQGFAIGSVTDEKEILNNPAIKAATENTQQIDVRNRARLKEIIAEFGWPGNSLVGLDGCLNAWLIVQHSDLDVPFQKECLALMQSVPKQELEGKHIAYLTDRVLVNEGRPQRYGTQMGNNFEPRELEDPDHVDERRAEFGLPPLAEYLQTAKEVYEQWSKTPANAADSE